MAWSFLVVPEWQGSGSSRAMRLVDGAAAVQGDLPVAATRSIDVPLEAGEGLGTGVHRISSLRIVHEQIRTSLAETTDSVITIGGDCGVSLGAIAHASERRPSDLAVIWFDAHPDLNSPGTSPSGNFNGMVLRAITGDGAVGLVADPSVSPGRIVLAGAREVDHGESDFIAEHGIPLISVSDLDTSDALVAAVAATGATAVYVHIDVDVLDPSEIGGVGSPVPFGISVDTLTARIRELGAAFPIVGASITEFAPSSPEAAIDDLPAILRIIAAITA
jgi:arginase